MPSTAPSTYAENIEGKLISAITTGTTTGVTFKIKQVNGVTPTCPTTAFRLHIIQKTATNTKIEKVGVAAGTTQSGQTVTLGTLTRALPLTNGTDFTGSGTAQSFAAGADVFLAWDSHDAAQTMKLDIVNTVTGAGAIRGDSTTVPMIRIPSVTTAQKNAMTVADGDVVYDSDLGQFQLREAGAWAVLGSSTVANGSTTVAGKFEEALVSEQGSATATGATGARLVPSVANLVKTSSGAGDENKLAVLGASGTFAPDFLGTGTGSSAKYLRGDGAWVSTLVYPDKTVFISGADSTLLTNPTSTTAFDTHTYTIPSGELITGVEYEWVVTAQIVRGTTTDFTFGVRTDGTDRATIAVGSLVASTTYLNVYGRITGTAAGGASVAVKFAISEINGEGGGGNPNPETDYASVSLATNGAIVVAFSGFFGTSNGGNNVKILSSRITKHSTTAS